MPVEYTIAIYKIDFINFKYFGDFLQKKCEISLFQWISMKKIRRKRFW